MSSFNPEGIPVGKLCAYSSFYFPACLNRGFGEKSVGIKIFIEIKEN